MTEKQEVLLRVMIGVIALLALMAFIGFEVARISSLHDPIRVTEQVK